MAPAKLYYFPIRGRAEMIKLMLAAGGQAWEDVTVDYARMKSTLDEYPFGQCPRLEIDGHNIVQTNTILRALARRFKMDGASEAEKVTADMIVEGVESLRQKYGGLIYTDQLSTKDAYWGKHCAKAGAIGKNNGGAHWEYLARMLRASKSGYAAGGSGMTVADIALWELCDLHMRIWPKEMAAEYPELAAHHAKVAAVPGVKAYLEGPQRLEKVNNNGFG